MLDASEPSSRTCELSLELDEPKRPSRREGLRVGDLTGMDADPPLGGAAVGEERVWPEVDGREAGAAGAWKFGLGAVRSRIAEPSMDFAAENPVQNALVPDVHSCEPFSASLAS
jgi:hypothetical protein